MCMTTGRTRLSPLMARLARASRSPRLGLLMVSALLLAGSLALSGCAGLFLGAAATGGVAVAQERSVGDAVDDLTIRTQLNALFFEEDIDLYQDIAFKVIEGRVLLTGSVETPEDRIRAVKLAWQANGVREVNNEIQVSDESGILNYARDTWISAQLKGRVLIDKEIFSINYNIETVNGTVYLVGIAQDQTELDRVTNHARTIPYVRRVVSHVILKDDPRREPTP